MTEHKPLYVISAALDEGDTAMLNEAKEKSGIKSNSDIIRFLLKLYTNKEFVPPRMRAE